MSKQREFIDKLKKPAIDGWINYKVLPSLTIAQAILETGWGKSSIGNNLFGIKADKNWTGKKKLVKTHEYINGEKIYVDAWFRDYDTLYEGIEDRFKFLQVKRYTKVIGEKDYKRACTEIYKAGYATDPNYPNKLIQIIEQNKLYEIDKLAFTPIKLNSNISNNTPSNWAKDGWEYCVKNKLIDGTRPKDNLTREELATVLKRLVD